MPRFLKYHALGNDFVVLDGLTQRLAPLSPDTVRFLCDRHRGVGCDQLLCVVPEPGTDGRMRVYNADASEVGQCGNGLRCVARFLWDDDLVPASRREVLLAAGAGRYPVERLAPDRYRARMGKAAFRHAELPRSASATGEVTLEAAGRSFEATGVHVGNPHAVLFVDEAPSELAPAFGPVLECHPDFAARANVSFVRRATGGFEAVVWERGDGITLACGSGACAVGAAAVARGHWKPGLPMTVQLPGGALLITVGIDGEIVMEGEAVRVFAGEVALP